MNIQQNIIKKISMLEAHQKLIESYKENEKSIKKSQIKAVILEFIMVAIVIWMKSIQKIVNLRMNSIATSCALILLALHFWNFYPRRYLLEKKVNIVLKGLDSEKQNSSSDLSFFQKYLKKFNIVEQILTMAIFDIILIYFFSVSYTQLIKAMNPEIMKKIRLFSSLSSLMINIVLGYAYYKPFKPIMRAKQEIKGKI